LAIFLGGLGIHKFYLNKPGQGVLYLIFFWTFIPAVAALVEAVIYLCHDDFSFQQKYVKN
jgi:TM2 domain-containing membrane protein YozV